MAKDASKILIEWTPMPNAFGQTVQRRPVGGTWTDIAGFSGGGTYQYTDTLDTTIDMPHTAYEYRIKTTIMYQPDVYSSVASVTAKNCPTANVTNIFGFKNEVTTSGNVLDFSYFDAEAEWLNNNWGTSKSTNRSISLTSYTSGNNRIPLVCHKCSEVVDYSLNPASFNQTVNGDFSYMEDKLSLASWLPTSPAAFGGSLNNNLGSLIRKLNTVYTNQIPPYGFQLGVGNKFNSTFYPFTGMKLSGLGTATSAPTYSSTFGDYNFRYIPTTSGSSTPFTSIRINPFITSNTQDIGLKTALENLTGNNVYLAIVDQQFTQNTISANQQYKCHIHMYKLTRWSAFDAVNGGSNFQYSAVGFAMTYVSSLEVPTGNANDKYVINSTPHYDVDFYCENTVTNQSTGRRAQPVAYLKIFTV